MVETAGETVFNREGEGEWPTIQLFHEQREKGVDGLQEGIVTELEEVVDLEVT